MKKARLNIYLDDSRIRLQVKTAAARRDISVSDYCAEAIAEKLACEGEGGLRGRGRSLSRAVEKARRFQRKVFGGETFAVSSSVLIRQARRGRSGR